MSPVRKPCLNFFALGLVRGNPYLSIKHICLHPCPYAVMRKGTISQIRRSSGVLLPTHAASSQWVLGSSLAVRLNFVRPPEPHSIGRPNAFNRSNNAKRVAFT